MSSSNTAVDGRPSVPRRRRGALYGVEVRHRDADWQLVNVIFGDKHKAEAFIEEESGWYVSAKLRLVKLMVSEIVLI